MSQNLQEPINPNAKPCDDGGDGGIGGADGILCTNCSIVNPTEARFCTDCGRSLGPMGQVSTMQFQESSSFSPYDAPVDPNAEASTATLLPSLDTEEASPITGKQEAISSKPLVSSPDRGGAIPTIRNWLGRNYQGDWRRRIRSRRVITIALIALILLLVVSSLPFLVPRLLSILPASAAIVTITPESQHMTGTYSIEAVTGTSGASQVQARLLSFTTMKEAKTVQATGQGSEGVIEATGTLIFSNSTGSFTIFAQTFGDNSGVGLVVDNAFNIFPGQTVAIFAHAAQAGSIGNVAADDINGTFNVLQSGTQIGTVHIQNPNPFSGGQDQAYTFVQQSDIDGAVASLQDQLTSAAQMGLQKLLHAGEQLVIDTNSSTDNGIQCTPNIKADHQANDRATNVTVTGSETCHAEAYVPQDMQSLTATLFQNDIASQLGPDYRLVGNLMIGTPVLVMTDTSGVAKFNVDVQGVWVYQFNDAQKQQLARSIAGKTQADARVLLLKQRGITKVSLKTSGFGNALPSSANEIKFIVVDVPGLKAAPTG